MTNNDEARVNFENKMKKEFDNRGVEAMRSLDIFDVNFTDTKRTDKELDAVEESLLDKDFDAILLTKIIGSENRQSFRKTMNQLYNSRDGFNEDYRRHQDIYYDDEYYAAITALHFPISFWRIGR